MFLNYIVTNFALLCIAVSMFFIVIYNVKSQTRVNRYSIYIMVTALLLSIFGAIESWARSVPDQVFVATLFTVLGYVVRPVCLYFFIQLIDKNIKYRWIFFVILGINLIIYSFSLFINVEALRKLVFYFSLNEEGTGLVFNRGYLNFTSHIVSFLLLIYFLIVASSKLGGKHKTDAVVLFVCSGFAIASVVLESLEIARNLLNVTIAVSCLFYYLYLYVQHAKRDALTGLFDRKSFYYDVRKFGKNINGVVSLDMNGLKLINDTKGHEEGDKAIIQIAGLIEKNTLKNAYVYRLGGDEFTILVVNGNLKDIQRMVSDIKEAMKTTKYSLSIGYAYDENKNKSLEELSKISDEEMYKDKTAYYQDSHIERRKIPHNKLK